MHEQRACERTLGRQQPAQGLSVGERLLLARRRPGLDQRLAVCLRGLRTLQQALQRGLSSRSEGSPQSAGSHLSKRYIHHDATLVSLCKLFASDSMRMPRLKA